jgi:uncharacterized membrane protein
VRLAGRRLLPLTVTIASLVWISVVSAAPYAATHSASDSALFRATAGVYVIGSLICHQHANRSFHTGRTQWPVCARCTGLYVGAPAGALLVLCGWRRRRDLPRTAIAVLLVAAIPTVATLIAEGLGPGAADSLPSRLSPLALLSSGWARAVAAAPLGAAVAWVVSDIH